MVQMPMELHAFVKVVVFVLLNIGTGHLKSALNEDIFHNIRDIASK